ncbi:NAD(P)-dependent oxidoreductase [bacterium]|nr:NAD(P)-dependent oxidoreductase [bacterium]
MKVLVTGGTSPLGLAVAQELKEEHQVYLADNESVETEFDFIQCNFLNMDEIQQAVKEMDAIIHLAELPHDVEIDPEEWEQQELDFATRGTYYLMRAAVSEDVQRVIYKSSLSVFDSCPEGWVVTETWLPRPKAEAKSMAKYLGELICREFARESNIIAICLRLGNIVHEEEIRGKTFDPMWVDIRDAAHAFAMALKVGIERSRFNVFHIQAENPKARFIVSKAKQKLSYQPKYDFLSE